ncbi:hypothetical protein ABT147_20080 [Streptomyces sp. NPDC001868]|uniref:hypothetical protein n=1 Tax=Streptomyces sp. NPDC001868 TaxID=3154401 RepID=UPI003330FC84
MGIYLVSVGAEEWFGEGEGEEGDDEDELGRGRLASALNEELRRRGLPPYESVPAEGDEEFVRGSGLDFEEKLVPPMDGFVRLCEAHLTREETETLCGWSLLVPFPLEEDIWLDVETGYTDSTMVAGAPQVLALAERLAAAVELPPETPEMCDNLDLTMWFLDGAAKELAAARSGPWTDDLDTAFYVALYLRAAQHSIRRGCPIVYC